MEFLTSIQKRIIEVLKKNGDMSRNEICEGLGFASYEYEFNTISPSKKRYPSKTIQYRSRTTVFDNLVKLEKKGIVKRFSINNGKVGASIKKWKLEGD